MTEEGVGADLVVPAVRRQTNRASAVIGIAAALVLALVGAVALLANGRSAAIELESRAKQEHFHAVFEKLEKKPSSGKIAQEVRARKHAIAAMSPDRARSVLLKWGFQPPASSDGSQEKLVGLRKVLDDKVLGTEARTRHGDGASRPEMTALRAEAGDDDLRPHRPDRTDERDEAADSQAVQRDREIADRERIHVGREGSDQIRHDERDEETDSQAVQRDREIADRERIQARREGSDEIRHAKPHGDGFGHLEDVAVNLAKAVHDDQEGIKEQKQKLRKDRNKLLNTRELIDKALEHLVQKSGRSRRQGHDDDADFTIKVHRDVQQQRQQHYDRRAEEERNNQRQTGERRRERRDPNDYWKIPIRPGGEQKQEWAHMRRRRAPDSSKSVESIMGDSYHKPGDALAIEEAASADGLMNVPASMASSLIVNRAPLHAAAANNYVQNVFGGGAVSDAVADTPRLRSAQPVAVQQYRKVMRMQDLMRGGERSMVSTYGQNYAAGTAGQPYAAENPGDSSLGETAAQVRQDNAYLSNVFDRK